MMISKFHRHLNMKTACLVNWKAPPLLLLNVEDCGWMLEFMGKAVRYARHATRWPAKSQHRGFVV
jgi:hypothetical protein